MRVFHYNSGNGFAHLEEDYGSITSPPDEVLDGGNLDDDHYSDDSDNNLDIALPQKEKVSLFKVRGKSKVYSASSEFIPHKNLNSDDIIFVGIVLTWIGFGTAFEFDNGYERIVSPYLSAGDMR